MANMTFNRQIVVSGGSNNMTGTSAVVSDFIDTQQYNSVSLEIQVTGTPTGTLTVEGTNQSDPANPERPKPGVTYTPLTAAAMTPALPSVAGAAVAYVGQLVTGTRFVRWRYVNSSGTGTLDEYLSAKGP